MKYNALNVTRDAIVALDGTGLPVPEEHRSHGGLRTSLYNAAALAAVETLCEAPIEFGVHHA